MRRMMLVAVATVLAALMSYAQSPESPSPAGAPPAAALAKNVILFLGDAGGLPTLNAASLYGYDRPQALFIQKMPAIGLTDAADYDVSAVVANAIGALIRNPKGYFLMVEWDLHTDQMKRGLDRTLVIDRVIRETVEKAGSRTLVIFAADHSFDIRLRGGGRGRPLLPEPATGEAKQATAPLRVDAGHTGEEVVVAAQGPGARCVHGFLANTDLFRIMMAAYGWKEGVTTR